MKAGLYAQQFNPDGSCRIDGTLRLWNVATARCLAVVHARKVLQKGLLKPPLRVNVQYPQDGIEELDVAHIGAHERDRLVQQVGEESPAVSA